MQTAEALRDMPIKEGKLVYTYDIVWQESKVTWATRWDALT